MGPGEGGGGVNIDGVKDPHCCAKIGDNHKVRKK